MTSPRMMWYVLSGVANFESSGDQGKHFRKLQTYYFFQPYLYMKVWKKKKPPCLWEQNKCSNMLLQVQLKIFFNRFVSPLQCEFEISRVKLCGNLPVPLWWVWINRQGFKDIWGEIRSLNCSRKRRVRDRTVLYESQVQ